MVVFLFKKENGPCGIRDHQDDWLVVENSNPRNSLPRREDLI